METINETWRPIFKEKLSLLLVETVFLASEKQVFFHLSDIRDYEKSFFRQMEMFFLKNASFRLVQTDILSSGKSTFLFKALLKLLKFVGGNSCLWKLIFWLYFSHFQILPLVKAIFRLVEKYF